MSYLVYVQDSETGKVVKFGAYDDPPYIMARDGTNFVEVPFFNAKELLKPEN